MLAAVLVAVGIAGCTPVARPRVVPSSPAPAAFADTGAYVVLVSFDGMRHDFLDRVPTPAFDEVSARGVRAESLIPIFPSKTFPNHYAIATGSYAGTHGIVANTFFDPSRGDWFRLSDRGAVEDGSWYGGEPIWATAERQDARAATWFWPGSEAEIDGRQPSYWHRYDGSVPDSVRVDSSIAWLRLPSKARPRLVALYFSGVDEAAHRFGPLAPQADSAVAHADRMLGRLLDSLAALPIAGRVNVVLVSDHGMAHVGADRVIALDTIAPLGSTVLTGDPGPLLSLWFGGDTARLEAAYDSLSAKLRHARVYRRAEIPSRWHVAETPRIGDLLVVAEHGWFLTATVPAAGWRPAPGQHGYDPADPAMHGIFLAAGPGIRSAGRVSAFENIHVHPLVAHLLGIEPSESADGRLEAVRTLLSGDEGSAWDERRETGDGTP